MNTDKAKGVAFDKRPFTFLVNLVKQALARVSGKFLAAHGCGRINHAELLGFRADILVANAILLEIKAAAALLPAHAAQIMTYLRMSQIHVGLLMNFHAPRLKNGLRRFIA